MFGGSGTFYNTPANTFDVLIVDEAHRLNQKSGLFQNQGEDQVREIIGAAKCVIFFVDDHQRVHIKDIGDSAYIEKTARSCHASIKKLELSSQFRCNGSDGYLAWLDNTLQINDTANIRLSQDDFDFRIFSDPNELRKTIEDKNKTNNKSRMVAGYCWDWKSKRNPEATDVNIPDFGFAMKWNLEKDGSTWIIGENSIHEIGCIHPCQGLELDYAGVIIGNDLRYENGKVKTITNHNGGVLGGISNGNPLRFTVTIKPTASIGKRQETVDISKKEDTMLSIGGRHDPCIVTRAIPVVENAAAFVLLDLLLTGRRYHYGR